jgi:hypothetical protein
MDRMTTVAHPRPPTQDPLVEEIMRTTGVERPEAEFIAALERGEIDGDIVFTRPPTPEERRRMGLDPLEDDELEDDV